MTTRLGRNAIAPQFSTTRPRQYGTRFCHVAALREWNSSGSQYMMSIRLAPSKSLQALQPMLAHLVGTLPLNHTRSPAMHSPSGLTRAGTSKDASRHLHPRGHRPHCPARVNLSWFPMQRTTPCKASLTRSRQLPAVARYGKITPEPTSTFSQNMIYGLSGATTPVRQSVPTGLP